MVDREVRLPRMRKNNAVALLGVYSCGKGPDIFVANIQSECHCVLSTFWFTILDLLVASPAFCSRFQMLGHMFILWVEVRPLGKQAACVTVAVNIGIIVTQSIRIVGLMLLE